jgi:hypothetical protein
VLEFLTDEAQSQHPTAEGVLFVVGLAATIVRAALGERLVAHRQAQHQVGPDFAGVKRPIKCPIMCFKT